MLLLLLLKKKERERTRYHRFQNPNFDFPSLITIKCRRARILDEFMAARKSVAIFGFGKCWVFISAGAIHDLRPVIVTSLSLPLRSITP